ncbi:hypothetical protein IFM89_005932 [Coptis chinensis]|uniref:Uncharacterized protein n=1 Tax=Coptis chinensis TaxID=261450 RepID=A0A835I988_9MAGN|nr:hypothetical protein IFM89_005932 [Coptis chinensis]
MEYMLRAEEHERSIEDIATIRIQTVFPGYKCVVVDWWCALCELVVCSVSWWTGRVHCVNWWCGVCSVSWWTGGLYCVDWWCVDCLCAACDGVLVCNGVTGNASTNIHKIGNQTMECEPEFLLNRPRSLLGNFISGTIPREIGSIPTLEELFLQDNNLGGPHPLELGNLRKPFCLLPLRISDLNVSSMDFPDLQELTKLEELVLRSYAITGPIPSYIGERMLNIKKLKNEYHQDPRMPPWSSGVYDLERDRQRIRGPHALAS